jgi:hypothetical protein
MGTDATLGYGSQLYSRPISGSGSGSGASTWTKFAATIDLKGPEPEIGDVKITNNDSPNRSHEYKAGGGLIEPGSQDFECVYNKTEQARIYAMFGDGNDYEFAEVYPDGAGWTYTGYLKKPGVETKTEDEAIHSTLTIKLTTKPQFDPDLGATVPGA